MTDHDHGLGLSGLRRIRQQHNPLRTPTLPSPTSRTPSLGALTRSSSLTTILDSQLHMTSVSSGPGSPTFAEDLSRFPSESLHSFSFAHQSEDLIHNRQNVLKRSIEFMKDRMGWSVAPNAAIASAQARVTGDVEMQSMLDLLARAQLVGASNLPSGDQSIPTGPLTGPAEISGSNVFEKEFIPRVSSPDIIDGLPLPPNSTAAQSLPSLAEVSLDRPSTGLPQSSLSNEAAGSEGSSRTSTNESGTTAQTSPPTSTRPSALKRTLTDTAPISMQQKLMDAIAKPFIPGEGGLPERPGASHSVSAAVHSHGTRWVPAAQAIFTTEAKPPWTILAANDLACLLFGVTKAEVRKMGIMEVVQEERRAWLEKQLQKGVTEDTGDSSESEIIQPVATKPVQSSNLLGGRAGGITAKLLSKPNSRAQTPKNGRRPATVHSGDPKPPKPGHSHHNSSKSRGVLLCGDVVPIQVRPWPCRKDVG